MGLPGIDDLAGAGKRETAKRFLKRDEARDLLGILAEAELTIVESVREQHAAMGVDVIDAEDLPSKEDRVSQLQELALAKLEGRFPEYIVETFLEGRLDHAEEASEFANLDAEEWEETKAEWAERYRDQGLEGSDKELARAHVRSRYDVDLEEFYALVVNWPEGRVRDEMQNIIADGVKTANAGINYTTGVLERADIEISDDILEDELQKMVDKVSDDVAES